MVRQNLNPGLGPYPRLVPNRAAPLWVPTGPCSSISEWAELLSITSSTHFIKPSLAIFCLACSTFLCPVLLPPYHPATYLSLWRPVLPAAFTLEQFSQRLQRSPLQCSGGTTEHPGWREFVMSQSIPSLCRQALRLCKRTLTARHPPGHTWPHPALSAPLLTSILTPPL